MGSMQTALSSARAYLVTLTGLPLAPKMGDPGNALGLAGLATVSPLNQNASVSLRWAGTPQIIDDPREPTDTSAVIGSKTIITRRYSAPRAVMRVFVDIRHGQSEIEHLNTLEIIAGAHPPNRLISIGVINLELDAGVSETQSDVFRTTFTGRLEFDWLEGATDSDVGTRFNSLTVEFTRDQTLSDPVLETIVITS